MLGSHRSGVGFLPIIAAVGSAASAAGGIMSAKAGADAAKDQAKAQIEIARLQAKAAAAASKSRDKSISSWVPIAAGAAALIGIVWAVAAAARRK